MPVMKRPRCLLSRSDRQKFSFWLLLGCASTGVTIANGGIAGTASADGLERVDGANPPGRAVTTISKSGQPIDWNQTKTPAEDAQAETQKVPAMLPTESVRSVLGIRVSEGIFPNSPPVGTSIQLLPPRREPVPPAAPAMSKVILESPTGAIAKSTDIVAPSVVPPSATPSARLVTRDDATISGFRTNWRPAVPNFHATGRELVLRMPEATDTENAIDQPAMASLKTPEVTEPVPPHESQEGLDELPSRSFPGKTSTLAVGDRQYYPSFMAPANSQSDAIDAMRQSPSTGPITGSGVRKPESGSFYENVLRSKTTAPSQSPLAPIEEMPSLDELDESELAAPMKIAESVEPETRLAPAITTKPLSPTEVSSPTETAVPSGQPAQANKADGGSNEGDSETGDQVDLDGDNVSLPNDLTMENLLSTDQVEPEPTTLSVADIKPLKIVIEDPQAELSKLQNAESDIDLKNVQEEIEPLPVGRLSQLDATGRLKVHPQPTALETIPPTIARLKSPVLRTLQSFHARTEHADSRSNWGMMHQIMVYGANTRIIARGRNYSAIAWMAGNNVCRGNRLMTSVRGKVQVREGTGLQGHQAQFLAVMSLVGVPSTYPLYVGNQRFSIKDLVEVEAAACDEGKELTFTLIGLAHYLDTDTTWAGARGEAWDFDRLIDAELSQPVVGAACGGTHRLMSFAHALRKRRLEGQPITGQWKRAENFLNEFVKYTYTLQNRDGSMSTNWFESPEDNGDLKRKVQTTGHMVEFLLTHLPDEELGDIRMTRAITFLVNALRRIEIDDSAVGYRGHALRSLAMYHRRMYGIAADYPAPNMAKQPNRRNVRRRR